MPNTHLTHQKIAREAAAILMEEAPFIANLNLARQEEFNANLVGYNVGETVRVEVPNTSQVFTTAVFGDGAAADNNQRLFVNLTISRRRHTGLQFTARERALDIADFREKILRPQMATLSSVVEADLIAEAVRLTPNYVGTYNTVPTAMRTYAEARAKLQNYLAPPLDRSTLFTSAANTELVDSSRQLFHAGKEVERGFIRGYIGEAQGAKFYEHQSMPLLANGTQAAWTVNGASQTGTSLNIGTLTATQTITRGTVFTIAGVFAVHPLTGESLGVLQQFVVTADFTAAAATGTISIFPAIAPAMPNRTVTASPAGGAACTPFGGASGTSRYSLMYHKDAFTAAFVPLPVLASTEGYTARLPNGLSVRVMTFGDGTNDLERTRIDVMYGIAAVRPLHACRLPG